MNLGLKQIIYFFIIILFFIGISFFGKNLYQFIHSPLLPHNAPKTTIIIEPGTKVDSLILNLEKHNATINHFYFHLLAFYKHANYRMRVGEYLINHKTTPNSLLNRIIAGKVYIRKITFIEGWTFKEMRKRLDKNPYIKHTISALSNEQIMKLLSSQQINPEGLFFPDTYDYSYGNTDFIILRNSYYYMKHYLSKQWLKRDPDLPYKDSYQALIVASMIEKEALLNKEKPIIAGVILNRLKNRMRLQIDPTILYGMGKSYRSPILKTDIQNKNPYNTYRVSGLPPTPISMPGAYSILAALHPQKNNYLYYVAKGDGSHQFSSTYHDHQIAVAHYRAELKLKNNQNLENFCIQPLITAFFSSPLNSLLNSIPVGFQEAGEARAKSSSGA